MNSKRAFTLVELLVVIAIIAILCALLLPTITQAKANALRLACLGNLRQISIGVLSYADDSDDKTPKPEGISTNKVLTVAGYKKLIQSYVGANGGSSSKAKLFACPADKFFFTVSNGFVVVQNDPLHTQSFADYSSYGFNGMNLDTNRVTVWLQRYGIDTGLFGVGGMPVAGIKNPSRTVLLAEAPAFDPFSWHQPRKPLSSETCKFNDAMNVVSFVDGHVAYTKMFWTNTTARGISFSACFIDSPPGYDYQWNRD